MHRTARAFVPVVGTLTWLLVAAMARPGAAQEPDPNAGPFLTPLGSPEDAVQPGAAQQPQPNAGPFLTPLGSPEESADPANWNGGDDRLSPGDVIWESIFGQPDPNCWRPLPCSTLFSEGWDEPWVPSPNGSGGAPRQGWINAIDGNMYRLWFFTFTREFNRDSQSSAFLGSYTLLTPFSRRLMLITNIPFVITNPSSGGLPTMNPQGQTGTQTKSRAAFGDVSFTPRVLLHETQDFSLTAEMAVVTPTGNAPTGGNTALVPTIGFWNNIGGCWVVRGGLGVNVPLNSGGGDSLISQLAIGQTLTAHDTPLFGDFTWYLSGVVNTPLSGGGGSTMTLTPGIRTHLGHDWYLLAGLSAPVTEQRTSNLGLIVWFMKAW